jgi:adenylosuccinate synthase
MKKHTKKLFTVTDLGPGDGGKGGVVHKIVNQLGCHTVVKVGGAQGSHGVRSARGERFNFSQFGCGTFDGARTHVSRKFVADPVGLVREGKLLQHAWKIDDVFDMITIDAEALCITPYHGIASRLYEIARKDKPRGTIGVGVGIAYRDAQLHPELAIRAGDLRDIIQYRDKLAAVREQKTRELQKLISADDFLEQDREIVAEQIALLRSDALVDYTIEHFEEMNRLIKIVDRNYLRREILSQDGTVVVESSHGVLTDSFYGFHPHTSKMRTLPRGTFDLLEECGYDGQVIRLGVTRAYQIRHGAGPMVTHSPEMVDALLPGSNKDENRYQGKVRVGPLDLVSLRYAISACGGPNAFDGIAISWFDQIQRLKTWSVCDHYDGAHDPDFFTPDGEIKVSCADDVRTQYAHQEQLGNLLRGCRPVVTTYDIAPQASREELVDLCASVLKEKLSVPVRMISFGPTEDDKVCL